MGELVFINVGHAGVRIGESCWELFCQEHGIDDSGKLVAKDQQHLTPGSIFHEVSSGKLVPRTLFVDTDCDPIDDIKRGRQRNLFSKLSTVTGKESCSSNFIRGQCTLGREIVEQTLDNLRRITQQCNSLQGMIFTHSVGGGTGSGLTSLLAGRICTEYGNKLSKMSATVYPSKSTLTSIVEPYNAVLSVKFLMEHIDTTLLFRNNSLQGMLDRIVGVENPSFLEINRCIAQRLSSVTFPMRAPGVLNWSLREMIMNLVPYPRAHFQMTSQVCQSNGTAENLSTNQLTQRVFSESHSPYSRIGTYMSNAVIYRGICHQIDIVKELYSLRENRTVTFADWVASGFKVALSPVKPFGVNADGQFEQQTKSVCLLSNNSAVQDIFMESSQKFDKLYSTRAFVHWYVGEGLDEGFFSEAREEQAALEKDYEFIDPVDWQEDNEEGFFGIQQ